MMPRWTTRPRPDSQHRLRLALDTWTRIVSLSTARHVATLAPEVSASIPVAAAPARFGDAMALVSDRGVEVQLWSSVVLY